MNFEEYEFANKLSSYCKEHGFLLIYDRYTLDLRVYVNPHHENWKEMDLKEDAAYSPKFKRVEEACAWIDGFTSCISMLKKLEKRKKENVS